MIVAENHPNTLAIHTEQQRFDTIIERRRSLIPPQREFLAS